MLGRVLSSESTKWVRCGLCVWGADRLLRGKYYKKICDNTADSILLDREKKMLEA